MIKQLTNVTILGNVVTLNYTSEDCLEYVESFTSTAAQMWRWINAKDELDALRG